MVQAALGRALVASGGTLLGLGAATMFVSGASMAIARVVVRQQKRSTAIPCSSCRGVKTLSCSVCKGAQVIEWEPFKKDDVPFRGGKYMCICPLCATKGEQICPNCLGEGITYP